MRIICSECGHWELTWGHKDASIEFLTPTGSSWSVHLADKCNIAHLVWEHCWTVQCRNVASETDLHFFHCLAWYNHCHCIYIQRKCNVRKHLYQSGCRLFPSYPSQTLEQHSTEASVLTLTAVKKLSPLQSKNDLLSPSTQITSAYGNKAHHISCIHADTVTFIYMGLGIHRARRITLPWNLVTTNTRSISHT